MSQEVRDALVASPNTIFQSDSQREDLRDPSKTQSCLIAVLDYLANTKNWRIEFTAIKSDHHNDSGLGTHCHYNGYCADLWPLKTSTPGDYLDASDPFFAEFLGDVASAPSLYQIGLAGTADTASNRAAAGPTVFSDDGGAHVHVGSQ